MSEVGLPSRTSHGRSLSGRADCGGPGLWTSGAGLEEEKRGGGVTEIDLNEVVVVFTTFTINHIMLHYS